MKRWHLSGYVFLAVVAALLLTVGAPVLLTVALGAQNTCEEADALYNVKLYDEAQKVYIELLKNDTHLTFAQRGINKSRQKKAEEFYRLGEEYRKARQYDLARNAYIEALKINSGYNESHEALAWVSGDPFAEVRTLADMGRYTEAGERFKKLIKENPGIDVPKDLEYLLGEKIFFWILPWWIRPLGELVLVLLIVFLIVRRIYNLRKPRLDIEDFDKGATNLDIGKGLAAMVEVSFTQIGESGAQGSRPSLIAGPIEKLEIPADVKSVPYIKILSALFEWVFRPDVYILSGYLQKSGGDLGAGLTLSLVRKKTGEIMANETIWQKNFDPEITPSEANGPAPYYRLAEPAAIWTLFQDEAVRDKLSRLQRIKRRIKVWFTFNSSKKKFALLGTSDWLSFAYFRAGVRWAREEKDNKARKLYLEALNQDMDNRGAWFNLGALDTEAGKYKLAIKRLTMARDLLKKEREKYWFCWNNISENDKRNLRRVLVADLGIHWAKNAEIYKYNDKTICCNDKLKYSAKITLIEGEEKATLKINDGVPHTLKVITEEKEKGNKKIKIFYESKDHEWYLATYQLAVAYHYDSMQQEAEDEAVNLVATIQEAIKILQKNENKRLRDFLKSFEPLAVIMCAGILAGSTDKNKNRAKKCIKEIVSSKRITYRAHYNLACYYSEISDNKNAKKHLEYALERGGDIVKWAKKDPPLKGLREDKGYEFDEWIKKCTAPVTLPADLLPLAGLRLIGETYAKQLKKQGIVSHADLILKADTPEARKKLASNLGINDKFLQRWALLADMMRIVGFDTQYANLLDAAGVRSLEDLDSIPIDKLVDSLCKLNAQCLVKQLLSVEIVKQWKEDARNIGPKVRV